LAVYLTWFSVPSPSASEADSGGVRVTSYSDISHHSEKCGDILHIDTKSKILRLLYLP
jgi:hypothetical protein